MSKQILKIATHSGSFHCDEAMACAMLKLLPQYADAEIIRTRDPAVIDQCDIVVDVGATYEPEKHRYDHHQRTFSGTLADSRPDLKSQTWAGRTKLSSAGLIYAHFGAAVLKVLTADESSRGCCQYQKELYKFVYENLIEEVDGVDNGVNQYSGDGLTRNYKVSSTIGARVSRLMPNWLEETKESNNDDYFPKAMEITLEELKDRVRGFHAFWSARDIVKEAIDNRFNIHKSGSVILLKQFCPWKKHVYLIEEDDSVETVKKGDILYCIFGEGSNFRVQCVSESSDSFKNRKSLPEAWRGIRNKELAVLTGQDDAIFVHATGFISGWGSKESALNAAQMAVEM